MSFDCSIIYYPENKLNTGNNGYYTEIQEVFQLNINDYRIYTCRRRCIHNHHTPMKTLEEVQTKKEELEQELDGLDDKLEEQASDEDIEDMTPEHEKLEIEYDFKEKALKGQIKLLEWILGE